MQWPAGEHNFTAVGYAVAVTVGEAQHVRRRSYVQAAAIPLRSHGHADLVGEDRAAVEHAIAVGVFEQADAHFGLVVHLLIADVAAGGFADK